MTATVKSRFEAINRKWVQVTRPFHLVTTNSGVGILTRLAEKAERVVNVIVERMSRFVKELSDAEMDELFPYV